MNNGNVNNNNKNNNNNVFGVSEFQATQAAVSPMLFPITEHDVREAYRICLKRKKATLSAVKFRINEDINIRNLWLDIVSGTYYPGTSIVFITEGREVFAADFRDRIVHTLVASRIAPILESEFVPTTWNCRKGKGTLGAVQNLRRQIREVSENYTKDAWVLIYDLSGFFMHIERSLAADRLCRFIKERYNGYDKETILWLIRIILTHAPENDCIKMGSEDDWANLPTRKSLFYNHGLPIGDLPSQLDGNFELDVVDHFITRLFESDRYVDDTVLVSNDKDKLLHIMPTIRELLKLTCGATVNPNKYKFCHWSKGFKYLGVIISKDKAYVSGKTIGRAVNVVRYYNKRHHKDKSAAEFVARINSYLGVMKHYETDTQREKLVGRISNEWGKYVSVGENNQKIIDKYPRRRRLKREIRDERRYFNNLKYSIKCKLYE